MKKLWLVVGLLFCVSLPGSAAFALPEEYSSGQVVYVPAAFNEMVPGLQTAGSVISVRNINMEPFQWIQVSSVAFYGPNGELVKEFLDAPVVVNSLASISFMATEETLGIAPFPMTDGMPSWVIHWNMNQNITTWPLAPVIETTRFLTYNDGEYSEVRSLDFTSGTTISGTTALGRRR
ncbi:MAG: DUF3124 domain-containing protein [Deltaproteobacteria bacterium]|nr:DUF3124 domain-containing protein [Deltaproteobacteria bacterium]